MIVVPKIILAAAFGVLCAALSGCTPSKTVEAAGKMAKIAMDPDTPIGPPRNQPSVVTVALYAEPGINKNDFGQAAPVDVWVFQLSDEDKLMSSDFLSLSDNPKGALDTTYVAHKQKQVAPGESRVLTSWKLKEDTTLVGVAVGYAHMDRVNWRAFERVNATGESYNIVVPIRSKGIAIQVHR